MLDINYTFLTILLEYIVTVLSEDNDHTTHDIESSIYELSQQLLRLVNVKVAYLKMADEIYSLRELKWNILAGNT